MLLAEARLAVYQLLDTAWQAQSTVPPVAYDNESIEPPTDGSSYALVTLKETGSSIVATGGSGDRIYARVGSCSVRLYVPANRDGTTEADALAEVARGALEGASVGEVALLDSVVRPVLVDGRWFVATVDTTFRYLTVH